WRMATRQKVLPEAGAAKDEDWRANLSAGGVSRIGRGGRSAGGGGEGERGGDVGGASSRQLIAGHCRIVTVLFVMAYGHASTQPSNMRPLSSLDCQNGAGRTKTIQQGGIHAKFQLDLPSRALHGGGRHRKRNRYDYFHLCQRQFGSAWDDRDLYSASG